MESIGPQIRTFRRVSNITGYDLARRIGRSAGWLSLVERGHFTPSTEDLKRIAAALDVPLATLLPKSEGA